MFLLEIFVWMFLKLVSYSKIFLQVTMNIGKIEPFQSNFTPYKLNIASLKTCIMGPEIYSFTICIEWTLKYYTFFISNKVAKGLTLKMV